MNAADRKSVEDAANWIEGRSWSEHNTDGRSDRGMRTCAVSPWDRCQARTCKTARGLVLSLRAIASADQPERS